MKYLNKSLIKNDLVIASILGVLSVLSILLFGMLKGPLTTDGGLFLYGGQELLSGHLPYVHFNTLKPPLIYFFSAFSVSFFHNLLGLSLSMVAKIPMILIGFGTV